MNKKLIAIVTSVAFALLVGAAGHAATVFSDPANCSVLVANKKGVAKPDKWGRPLALEKVKVGGQTRLVIKCVNDLEVKIRDFHIWAEGESSVFKKITVNEGFKKGQIFEQGNKGGSAAVANLASFWSPGKKGGVEVGKKIDLEIRLLGNLNHLYRVQATTTGERSPVAPVPLPASVFLSLAGLSLLGGFRFVSRS